MLGVWIIADIACIWILNCVIIFVRSKLNRQALFLNEVISE